MYILKFATVAAVLLLLTRWPLAPKYLYHFDSVNFALALDDFDPAKHQPQPPGYALFVGLAKLVFLVVKQPEKVLVIAGLLVALASLLCMYGVAKAMFGARAGLLATSLLLFCPPFWFAGVTNQVRVCLALCSTGVALLAWRALVRPGERLSLLLAFAGLGIAAGFRPEAGVLLLPMLLFVWWRAGRSARDLMAGSAIMAASAFTWILPTAAVLHGFDAWIALMWNYANEQFRGSSALFGAEKKDAWRMAKMAFVWNFMGTLAWLWALPFTRWRADRLKVSFLAVWFLPPFLFSVFVHIGDPDQSLASVPVLCVAGAAVLDRFIATRPNSFRVAAGVSAALSILLFFFPLGPLTGASSFSAVSFVDRRTRLVMDSITELRGESPVTILHFDGFVTWRQLSYYFPGDFVVYLPTDPAEQSWTLHRRRAIEVSPASIPDTPRLILLAPNADPGAMKAAGWQTHGPLYHRVAARTAETVVGAHRLRVVPVSPQS